MRSAPRFFSGPTRSTNNHELHALGADAVTVSLFARIRRIAEAEISGLLVNKVQQVFLEPPKTHLHTTETVREAHSISDKLPGAEVGFVDPEAGDLRKLL